MIMLLSKLIFIIKLLIGVNSCPFNEASSMFIIDHVIYVSSSSSNLFSFNLKTKKHGTIHWENLIGDHSIKKKPRFMIDFDPYNSCDPATSNAGFCERSTVFANLIALIGEKSSDMFTWDRNKSKIIPYQYAKTLISENDFSLIPSTNLRMFALLKDLFDQMSHNRHLLFTGATYEHFRDSLFTVATVIDDRIINRKSWINARHVLMRANFIPSGMLQDSFVVNTFPNQINGLIDYNGRLYGLTDSLKIIAIDGSNIKEVDS